MSQWKERPKVRERMIEIKWINEAEGNRNGKARGNSAKNETTIGAEKGEFIIVVAKLAWLFCRVNSATTSEGGARDFS